MFSWNRWIGVGMLAALFCGDVLAQDAPTAPVAVGSPDGAGQSRMVGLPTVRLDELSAVLKEKLLANLPAELVFDSDNNWGHQTKVAHVLHNNGDWEKTTTVAADVPQRLSVRVDDLYSPAENRIAFTLHLTIPAKVHLRTQVWLDGVEVYKRHVRARFQLSADLNIEAVLKPAGTDAADADRTAGFGLSGATFTCSHFVAENIDGVGGDFARMFDGQVKHAFRPWQTAILQQFQKTVTDGFMAAGDTREFRASLSKVLVESLTARTALEAARAAEPSLKAAFEPVPASVCIPEHEPLLPIEIEIRNSTHQEGLSHDSERVTHEEKPGHFEHMGLAAATSAAHYPKHYPALGLVDHSMHVSLHLFKTFGVPVLRVAVHAVLKK